MPPYTASKSNAKSAEASTVYTFTPAVLPKPLKGQGSSDFSVSSPVGQILGQRGSIAAMSSPVMAADEIFRLAGWSTPSFFSQQHPNPNPANNNNASLFNIQHRLSLSPHPNHLGSVKSCSLNLYNSPCMMVLCSICRFERWSFLICQHRCAAPCGAQ